ncbi:MAG: polyprenyl synthetase family protein [Crocinitomicaceae bacterium]|nr:polyprenyl synthetase family protein [Crocinitomicaceae bacterium]
MQASITLQALIEEKIEAVRFPANPANLYAPLNYFMTLGGKRTRPLLTLLGCVLFGKPGESAVNAAIAVELFHNFTLIHDDIMDKAPLRRGMSTVHTKWNENIAILSGDVLFVKAFEFLSNNDVRFLPQLIAVFTRTAAEVCEGQQMDMDFESRQDVTIEEYIEMIRLKTSVLLGAALEMGAIIAEASEEDKRLLYEFGMNVGIAFQLKDDILDLYADPDKFGKQVGGDILSNKKTFLLLTAEQNANSSQRSELKKIMDEFAGEEKIEAAKNLFDELGIQELAMDRMKDYYAAAKTAMDKISVPESAKQELLGIADYLMNREV